MNKIFSTLISLILLLNIIFAVGLQSLNIPISSDALAMDNAGIAMEGIYSSNPANRVEIEMFSYGSRYWIDGFIGHMIEYDFGHLKPIRLTFETIKDEKIEHYGSIPQDESLGTIPVSWYSLGVNVRHSLMGKQVGIEFKPFMNLLYNLKLYGLAINAGILEPIGKNFSIGFAVKNLGWIKGDFSDQKMPTVFLAGLTGSFINNKFKIFTDIRMINSMVEKIAGLGYFSQHFSVFGSMSIRDNEVLPGAGIRFNYGKWSIHYSRQVQINSALGIPQFFNISRKI